jgi:hypothetical protein
MVEQGEQQDDRGRFHLAHQGLSQTLNSDVVQHWVLLVGLVDEM